MKNYGKLTGALWLKLGVLFVLALTIGIFSLFPFQVEYWYSVGVYPGFSSLLRMITRHIPFSIGDIAYIIIVIYIVYNFCKRLILIYQKKYSCERLILGIFKLASILLWSYIIFKLCWGLNYNRLGIDYQLKISKKQYNKEEVTFLTKQLIDKVNECRRQIKDTILPEPSLDSIFREAYRSYQTISITHDFLNYRNRSIKGSLYSRMGDFMGFSGYYNPFSGEAQLRTDIPRILIPYIACHEIAHQLGYASESEANFVGYMAASASKDVYFRYSLYNDLFSYAQAEEILLYGKEKDFKAFETVIKYNRDHLDTLVKKDRKEIREFFNKRKNRISPAVSGLYDQYLKLNKQSKGIDSYNEIIGWLLAYQKKYGKI